MKKLAVLGMGVCMVLAFSSCKSSESAYKKAYEKAKQQELAEPQTTAPVEEVAPVVSAPVEAKVVESAPVGTIRQEKVTVVSGVDGLKDYSVVCGSFGVKANAENLKNFVDGTVKARFDPTFTIFDGDAGADKATIENALRSCARGSLL